MAAVAGRQWGIVTRAQLREAGLSESCIGRWLAIGRIHRVHPAVYAVGHQALSREGRLIAALFHAGPGAVLSHLSAAWRIGLVDEQPERIDICAPGRTGPRPGIAVHHPRLVERMIHRGLPVTPVGRTLLDVAADVPERRLRRMVAEADYRRLLDMRDIERRLGRGRRGSAALRRALAAHLPELALTLSELERRFLLLCEQFGLALPEMNRTVEGLMVDALWGEARLVVELDGLAAHETPASVVRDRERELLLRRAGYTVVRYSWRLVVDQPEAVAADVRRALVTADSNRHVSPPPSGGKSRQFDWGFG